MYLHTLLHCVTRAAYSVRGPSTCKRFVEQTQREESANQMPSEINFRLCILFNTPLHNLTCPHTYACCTCHTTPARTHTRFTCTLHLCTLLLPHYTCTHTHTLHLHATPMHTTPAHYTCTHTHPSPARFTYAHYSCHTTPARTHTLHLHATPMHATPALTPKYTLHALHWSLS